MSDVDHSVDEELLQADGFGGALLCIGRKKGCSDSLVYDYDKCVLILVDGGMSEEDAIEWMEFNVVDAYVGPTTPIFVQSYDSGSAHVP